MHIVLFNFYSTRSNSVYQEIGDALRRRGHSVSIGAPNFEGNLEWYDGKRVFAVQTGPKWNTDRFIRNSAVQRLASSIEGLKFVLRVRRFLEHVHPDIIQVNTSTFVWLLPFLMPSGMHFVMDIRQINEKVSYDTLVHAKEVRDILTMRLCAKHIYEHTCFCHAGAATRIMGCRWQNKASVVPVGVDERFLRYSLPFRSETRSRGPVCFVYVGTLSLLRDLHRILYAAKEVMSETDDFRIDFVGPDTSGGLYKKTIDQLGIGSIVTIKPPVPYGRIPNLLAEYDVGLAYVPDRPTWHYQPTIKVLEYRAIGMPIISTDVASHRSLVLDGVNGFLVADSVVSLADAIKSLIMDNSLLLSLKENARCMREGRTWDDIAAMYEQDVYNRLMNGT